MQLKVFVGVSNNVKTVVTLFAIVAAVAYFVFHAITGENGFVSYIRTKNILEQRTQILIEMETELARLKRNVYLLSNNSIDLDMLEERCRVILNYSFPDDSILRTSSILKG